MAKKKKNIRQNRKQHNRILIIAPYEEGVHLLQTELQDLLLKISINLGSNLQVLLKHLSNFFESLENFQL